MWASNEVLARIGEQVQPQVSLSRKIALAATTAFVFTWVPAFLALAITTLAVPSATDEAGVGTTAFWALQLAVLIAITAVVSTWRRNAEPDAAGAETPGRPAPLRIAIHVLVTGTCAALVLAAQGLSTGQIASLTIVLVAVLHLLPVILARLLRRGRRRSPAPAADPGATDPVR
ncbi:hypothetical protein Pen02_71080 [Plantactinospora endophytica]|uniref:Uncharacterized protein n=1 Tax=Plantactinospora endophytica TaxID=673535 RepID=A0ABQ4EBR4_9ACTN|nr:hypothetical protein Pen02_71080 [Plantactinospora endophytica]